MAANRISASGARERGAMNDPGPGVCVVIAGYNAETTVARAIGSALAEPQVAEVIVVINIQDDVLDAALLFHLQHAAISLINAVAADAVVSNGFLEMRRQILLPGLAVADLIAVGEAVAVGMDAARFVAKLRDLPGPVRFIVVKGFRIIYAIAMNGTAMHPSEFRVIRPAIAATHRFFRCHHFGELDNPFR